jgi:hypothetical protein
LEFKIISSIKPKCDDPNASNAYYKDLDLKNDLRNELWNDFGMTLE